MSTKVVILGGSGVATPELAAALSEIPDRQLPLEVVLVGRSAQKLALIADIARLMAGNDPLLKISCTTDTAAALQGAALVLNQLRVGGLEARAFDETYPHEFGLPGEETVGPGGFANASRTIPTVVEYARLVEQICPQAVLLTFANPSSLVQYAITQQTGLARVIGLCDGPITLSEAIARALQAPLGELEVDYVGMHHFGWAVGVWRSGQDVLAQTLAQAALAAPEVEPAITQAIGAIPGPYLNYVFHPDRMLAKKQGKRPRAGELLDLQDELLAEYEQARAQGQKPAGLVKRKAKWYRAIIAPVIVALLEKRTARFALNLVNHSTLPWLPEDAIIEVPCLLHNGVVRPLSPGQPPPDVRALLQRNCAYEQLAVKAILAKDRPQALRALLQNPIIHTYEQARLTLEKAWGPAQFAPSRTKE